MKVFCIGYPRTGTTSLTVALRKLGYRSCWHCNERHYKPIVEALKTGEFSEHILKNNDCFADIPIPFIYKKLDKLYPKSKFILVTRDKNDWFGSMKYMLNKAKKKHPQKNGHNEFLWSDIKPEMIEDHTKEVKQYFSNRSDDIFVVDLKEINFGILASFLDKKLGPKIKANSFPHGNKRGH